MMQAWQGKIAVVTGASRGIGRAVAIGLAQQGVQVVLVARGVEQLQTTQAQIKAVGGTAWAVPADLGQPATVDALKAQLLAQVGTPSILINAAGVFGPIQLIKESDPTAWIETIQTNTIAPYLTSRAFVGGMIDQGWGRIINVSSAAALHTPGPTNSAYGTSKAALNHFTRHLAAELAGTGVTANVIHPGEVKTEMWADIRDQAEKLGPAAEGYRRWARWVDETGGDPPEKSVDLVYKLLSDAAAAINGQFLWIEGGLQTPIPSW
ncbi:MAG: SDR family oxidoreductase [Caldilineaceae bacterium]|nr:SDR family oxidoreductase [Caldilineaceae bacterium]